MRVHGSWYLKLEADGSLSFKYDDAANRTYTIRSTVKITDTKWHDIDLTFDTDTGKATFYVDGDAAGQGAIGQRLQGMESWGFSIGNPFGSNASATFSNIKMWTKALTPGELNGEVTEQQSSSTVTVSKTAVADVADDPASDRQAAVVEKVAAPEAAPASAGAGASAAGASAPIKTFDLSHGLGDFLAGTRYDDVGGIGSVLKEALGGAAGASSAPLGDLLATAFATDGAAAFDYAGFSAGDLHRAQLVHEGVLLV